jgi:alpha-tubulin suppressor-like RCC1 family protein
MIPGISKTFFKFLNLGTGFVIFTKNATANGEPIGAWFLPLRVSHLCRTVFREGEHIVAFLTSSGNVYAWGLNQNNQLAGNGSRTTSVFRPTQIEI